MKVIVIEIQIQIQIMTLSKQNPLGAIYST